MLRYCAGFEYDTGVQEWSVNNFAGAIGTTTGGRVSGRRWFLSFRNDSITTVSDGLGAAQTWFVGCAFMYGTAGVASDIIALIDAGGNTHCTVRMGSDQKLYVTRAGTTLIGPGATTLTINVWYYIEFKVKIDDTTGTADVRVNGLLDLSGTGLDTRNGGSASADRVQLGSLIDNTPFTGYWDDFYACDSSGSVNNDYLGDIRVVPLYPNGNGATSNLAGSDGNSVNNYALVNEVGDNDGDTSYVQSATVNDKDTYAMDDLTPTSGTVYGVKTVLSVKKDDAGARSVAAITRLSGTEVLGSDRALSTTYQHLWDIRETKPGGGSWSIADVNGVEVGMKVTV